MRKNLGAKTFVFPMPVFIIGTYDEAGVANAMNAAWGGISEEKEITICIDDKHKTAENLMKTGAFTVSVATANMAAECDYVGIVSGNDTPDKLEKCGFTTSKSEFVNAPIINELPMALECKVKLYDKDRCRLVGEIVNISCQEDVLNGDKIDVEKLKPITYDGSSHVYRVIGEEVARAFSAGKKFN